jgi:hypothetical protein
MGNGERLELLKAFAGPFATIVASVVGGWIAIRLGALQRAIATTQVKVQETQTVIAKYQSDIAYDRLKYDLFDKRYEIYSTAREIVKHIVITPFDNDGIDQKLKAMHNKLDEARFLFPPKETGIFHDIAALAEAHEAARLMKRRFPDSEDIRMQTADAAGKALQELVKIDDELPRLLEKELGFAQLTVPRT